MPIEVLLPDGSTRSFPNGTPEDEIRSQLMPASPTEKLRQDSGIPNPPGLGGDTLNRFLKGGAEGVAKAVQGTVRGLGSLLDLPNPKATPYYQWAERLSEGAKEAFPTDPARDPRFLSTLVESAGQMVPTIAASLVTPAAAVAQYGMAQGEQMAQEAEAAGRPDRANRALLLGALTGAATEGLLGVAPKFGAKLFGREAAGSLPRAFAEGSVKEGTQEGLEQLAQNQIAARETLAGYDPERPATAGVLESMAAGALLGGPVNAAAAALGPKVDHATVQATIDQAEARLENEEDQNTRLALEATVARGKELLKLPGLRVRRNRKPGFEDIAQQEGMSAVVDFVTDPGRQVQEDGKTVAVSEADTDLSTGRVKIYLPEVRSTSHLRGLLREEKTHLWLNTVPEGQTAFQTYLEQHPISPETVAALQEQGYLQEELTDQEYRSRLTDEFLAKLAKDDWWTRTTGELVAIVKNGLGLKLSSEQAGRLLLRNARKWTATSLGTNPARQGTQTEALTPPESVSTEGGVVAPTSLQIRESLRAVKPDEELVKLSEQYPGVKFSQDDRPSGHSAQYDPEQKTVSLRPDFFRKWQWERDNEVRTALMEAGVNQINPKALSDDIFVRLKQADPERVARTVRSLTGSDVSDPPEDIRQQVAARILLEQINDQRIGTAGKILGTTSQIAFKLSGLARLATRMGLAWSGHSGSRGMLAAKNLLDNMVERAQLPPIRIEPNNPAQAFVDLHPHVVEVLSPGIRDLRARASELDSRSYARRLWLDLSRRVDTLTQEALITARAHPERLAAIPAEAVSFEPMAETLYEGTLEAVLDRQLTADETRQLDAYREERRARGVVHALNERDKLEIQLTQLGIDQPDRIDVARQRIQDEIAKLTESIQKAKPQHRMRADEIRASDAMVPYARAAQAVIDQDPDIREWASQYDQAEDSGLSPRPEGDITEALSLARQALRDRANVQAHTRAEQAERELGEFLAKEYTPELRSIRGRIVERTRDLLESRTAMSDLVLALAGEADLSGTLSGRDAATALRNLNSAVSRLAIRMAQARADTLVGQMREQLRVGVPGESAYWINLNVAQVAQEVGLGEQATRQILQLLSKSPEFHNALFELHKNARGEAHQAVITAIERIEQALRQAELRESVDEETEAEKYRALAKSIAETRIDELSDITRGLKRDITSVERELAELEQRRLEKQYAADFFRTAADAFGELPNMRRMVFNTTDGGRRFEGFANVKPIVLRPGSAVSNETLKSLTQWCAAGTQALADGSVDPQTLRGLAVGIPEAEKFISERFTDEQISKTLAPSYAVEWLSRRSWFRTKGLLPRLVPGLWGANVQQHQLAWNELHAKVEKLKIDEASRWDRLQRAAAKSLGLDPARRPGDAAQLYAAYNETANRLRRHNSGVEEGMLLWSTGGMVTPELLTWLQYDSKTLRKGTKLEAARPFGGVRENFPGRQVVRPGAPTGDIGLPRRANPSIVDEMRKVYVSAPRDAGRYTDRSSLDQWWARHSVAIGSHIQDPVREDVVVNRKPAMVQAELALSRAIDSGRVSLTDLRTIDDWADAIQAYIPATEQLDARTELRNELDQYGAHAVSRFGGMDSSSPSKTALTISGEDDTTAFTQPASKMYYPPAFYQYGTSTGLSSALDQIADPAQKEYLESLIQAKEHLSARAGEIKRAIASGDYGNNTGLIRWVLEGQLGKTLAKGRDAITPDMAQTAADALDARAAVLATELTRMSEPQRGSLLTRLLNQIYPFLLLRPTVLASNVFGGPIAAQPVLASFFGPVKGSLLSFGAFPFSAGSMLWSQATDLIRWTAKLAHIDLPPPQIDQYLEAYGIGASINHELTGEGERAAAGRLGLSGPAKALALTRGAANEASKIIGVRAGDKYLNRAMSQSVIPAVMWRLKSVAAGWKARAQQAVAEGRAANLIDVTFDETDSGQAPQIREFLTSFGKPEELLAQIAGADFPWAKWWTNELAGRMGYALLQDVNVATPTNRPARNTLLGLVGWTAKMIDSVTALTRVTPETSTAERLRRATAYAILGALAASTAYYFQILGRQTVNGGIVAGATIIAQLLQGLPVDPDDPTWAEKALNVLAAMNGWLRHHSPMLASAEDLATRAVRAVAAVSPPNQKALPYQPGFWERPWRDIALDLATAAPAGIGINQVQLPVLGIAEQTAASTLQIGRGAVTFAESPDDAGRAAALADLKAGTRNIANLFGLVGGAAMAFLVPGSETGRDTRSLVAGAANAAGVRMEAPFQSGSFLSRTPIRKELMAAGTDLATAQGRGDNAGIEAAQKKIDDLTQYVADRAARRATELGQTPAEAKKAGEAAVKKLMGQLDPIRYGIGRSVTPEELSKLEARIGQNPAIQRDRAASKAIVARVASRRRFRPTRSMLSPLRKSKLPRVKLGRSQSRKIRL